MVSNWKRNLLLSKRYSQCNVKEKTMLPHGNVQHDLQPPWGYLLHRLSLSLHLHQNDGLSDKKIASWEKCHIIILTSADRNSEVTEAD